MTLTLLVPSSLVREAEDKREATRKLGYVARAAAVFRADRLLVFPDREGEPAGELDGEFVRTVLAYAATPPYLRAEVWDRRRELEYAGVLPPLGLPSWTGSESSELREGLVTEVGPDGRVRVTCGMQHPVSVRTPPDREVTEGERVAIRVSSREPVRARLVDGPPPGVAVAGADLEDALACPDAGTRIATSRHGTELTVGRLAALPTGGDLTVAFGAPGRGLPAVLGVDPGDVGAADPAAGFDRWLNTVPRQGSATVRTEEAMFASLAALGLPE